MSDLIMSSEHRIRNIMQVAGVMVDDLKKVIHYEETFEDGSTASQFSTEPNFEAIEKICIAYSESIRALIANSPQTDGKIDKNKIRADVMCQSPKTICKAIDFTIEAMLSAYKPQADDVRKDAERFRWLMNNTSNQLTLRRNCNASNYETAEQEIEGNPDWYQDDPREEIEKMKANNTIWSLQYYPDTPIGFYNFNGASLCNVIDRAIECSQAIDKARD